MLWACNDWWEWTWQSCSPLSVGFPSGPRKSAGEIKQSRWSPDAAALQGSAARTRTLKHSQQHTAWTLTTALTLMFTCEPRIHTRNGYNSGKKAFLPIADLESVNTKHESTFIPQLRLLLPEQWWWIALHIGNGCQTSGLGRVKKVGSNWKIPSYLLVAGNLSGWDRPLVERLIVIYTLVNWKPLCHTKCGKNNVILIIDPEKSSKRRKYLFSQKRKLLLMTLLLKMQVTAEHASTSFTVTCMWS